MKSYKIRDLLVLIFVAFVLVCSLFRVDVPSFSFPLALGLSLVMLAIPRQVFSKSKSDINSKTDTNTTSDTALQKNSLVSAAQSQVSSEITATYAYCLGTAYRKEQWENAERLTDQILDIAIRIIKAHVDPHTIAIFFPAQDQGYQLRRYLSKSEFVKKDALIKAGCGIIGGLLKDGLKPFSLPDISNDSTTLYYYVKNVGVRSCVVSPIIVEGSKRGLIVVDSLDKNSFTEEKHAFISQMADLVGQAVFCNYLNTEHRLEHQRISSMSTIEKDFFKDLQLDKILDKIVEIIPYALQCNRLTISIRDLDTETAIIERVWGEEVAPLDKKCFSLTGKTLISLLYAKNLAIYRNFSREHYEYLYDENENSAEMGSFLAVPIGVDQCKGMILIESVERDVFTESNKDLISRIATSAGLALEKIQIIEQANNLATHDGLTGLLNHRQFQVILADEITRSIRYNDPLALVIADIDFFKKINDTYGHQFGDTVLKGVSARLQTSVRDSIDTAARYGGEEFALVLVKTDEKGAIETAERIRQSVQELVFRSSKGEDVHVTMSFGIAIYKQHARQIDELIKKADKALYRAKENGRNRVEVF